jgi:hypothetical protein
MYATPKLVAEQLDAGYTSQSKSVQNSVKKPLMEDVLYSWFAGFLMDDYVNERKSIRYVQSTVSFESVTPDQLVGVMRFVKAFSPCPIPSEAYRYQTAPYDLGGAEIRRFDRQILKGVTGNTPRPVHSWGLTTSGVLAFVSKYGMHSLRSKNPTIII